LLGPPQQPTIKKNAPTNSKIPNFFTITLFLSRGLILTSENSLLDPPPLSLYHKVSPQAVQVKPEALAEHTGACQQLAFLLQVLAGFFLKTENR
jgi:hypothetical protein